MVRIRNLVFAYFVASVLTFNLRAQTGSDFHGCPAEGDATDTTRSDVALNLLKNRTEVPADDFKVMHFDDLAGLEVPEGVSKKHRDKWPAETVQAVDAEEKRAVRTIGYILSVKLEGPESPNCHSDNQADRDFHIWLANSADAEKAEAVVVEITPRVRAHHPGWTKVKLAGLATTKSKVRVSGWILMDPEHPDQVGKTRATTWEIHPVLKIEIFSGGKWREL